MTEPIKAVATIESPTKKLDVKHETSSSPKSSGKEIPAINPACSSHKGRLIDVTV